MKPIFLLLFPACFLRAQAQLPPACAGGSPATECAAACINCNFNGYTGSTAGFPSGIVPNFCGTVENAQWIGFIAGEANATFSVVPSNCSNGDGLQVALYEDCMGQPLACEKGEMNGGNLQVSMDVMVTPGRNYFLMIDGYAGDQCDFTVKVTPENAVYEPPLGDIGGIGGPSQVCPGATMTYTVAEVFGAGAYIWSGPPGAMIDTMLLPVTLVGAGANHAQITFGDQGGQICVQAANSCNQTPPCSNPFQVQMLDDSYRPVLETDTSAHLTCSGEPAVLKVEVQVLSGFVFQWSSDSSGHIVSGAASRDVRVDKTGIYTLSVTNNQNGCSSTVDIHVGEPDTPSTAALHLKNVTCYGFDDGILNIGTVAGGLAPFSYAMDGEDFAVSPEFRYLKPGPHQIIVQTADECRWDTTITVLEPKPFVMDLGADTAIHLGSRIRIWQELDVTEPERISELLVKPAVLEPMLCDSCQYEPLNSFRYVVTAVDSNGCQASDDRIVSVMKDRYVYVPNVFRPGAPSDGNDMFTVFGGEDVERVAWLRVFDRWGQLVFQQESFAPNDSSAGWDGRIKGDLAAPAVFVWQTEIVFKDGAAEKWSGNVTLLR